MPKLNKKIAIAVSAAAIVAIGGGTAFAYWSTSGSGTGTGTAGTSQAVTLNQASITYSNAASDNAFVPGSSAAVTFTADNPSSGHQFVNTISLASVTSDKAGCDSLAQPTWFTMPPVTSNTDVAPGNSQSVTGTGTITFNNKAVSQDVCKGAALTFHYSSN